MFVSSSAPRPDIDPVALSHAIDAGPGGALVLDTGAGYRCAYANPAACALLDMSPDDAGAAANPPFALLFDPRERPSIEAALASGGPGGWSTILCGRDGGEHAVEFRFRPHAVGGRPALFVEARDVEAARRAARNMAALGHVAAGATYAGSLEATLEALARGVVAAIGIGACLIMLLDDEGRPYIAGSHNLPDGYVAGVETAWRANARPVVLRAVQERRTVIMPDVRALLLSDPAYAPVHDILRRASWDSIACVPLIYRGRALGALVGYYPHATPPRGAQLALLRTAANGAAVAVENARLADAARERAALAERNRASAALRSSEERFRTLVEQSPFGIQIFAPDGLCLSVNRAYLDMWDLSADYAATHITGHYNILDDRDPRTSGVASHIRQTFAGETMPAHIASYPAGSDPAEESPRWIRSSWYPLKDDAGRVAAVACVMEDITGQRRAEEELGERETQYRAVFEAVGDGLLIADMEGFVVEANPAACRMYGYTRDELIGLRGDALIHPDYRHHVAEALDTVGAGSLSPSRIAINVRKDGTPFYVEGPSATFTYRGQPHMLAVLRDVTERVRAEELLERRVAERTRELATLLDVSHAVASTLELGPLLDLILVQLGSAVGYTGASVNSVEGDAIVVLHRRGPGSTGHVGTQRFPLAPQPETWALFARGTAVIIDDVRGDTALAGEFRAVYGHLMGPGSALSYVRAWMAVPLVLQERTIGTLALGADTPNAFRAREAELARAIAAQAAVAIENARLYEQARRGAAIEERQRLARELHDSVSQTLYGIALGARTARTLLDRADGAASHNEAGAGLAAPLDYMLSLAETGLAEMRALIFEMRPDALATDGLVAALERHVQALRAQHGLAVEAALPAEPAVGMEVKETLYRIAQESLHNATKHARARTVRVRLEKSDDGLELEVADDGVGFDLGGAFPGHLGLRSMRERAERLGGVLEVESAPGRGTCVRAVLPPPRAG